MKHAFPMMALFAALTMATADIASATSANGTRSGSSFGGGSGQTTAAGGGTSADGGASGNSFGSTTIGTDRINADDDSDGVADAQDTAPEDNTRGGLDDIDTDNDGVSDAGDPTPTIPDGDVDTTNTDGSVDADGNIGTSGDDEDGTATTGSGDAGEDEAPDFSLESETDLPNPNNPDPRLNNGTTADDGAARD